MLETSAEYSRHAFVSRIPRVTRGLPPFADKSQPQHTSSAPASCLPPSAQTCRRLADNHHYGHYLNGKDSVLEQTVLKDMNDPNGTPRRALAQLPPP